MLYLPDKKHLERLNLLQWPLPKKLLPWLRQERGLGIVVLPPDPEKAYLFVKNNLKIKEKKLKGDGRLVHLTSHFMPDRKLLIMSNKAFWLNRGENVFLHELGHALDFLYSEKTMVSYLPKVWKALRPKKPLNKYCSDKQKKNKDLVEQFATSFAAYFNEHPEDQVPTIRDLSSELIDIFNFLFIKPFE